MNNHRPFLNVTVSCSVVLSRVLRVGVALCVLAQPAKASVASEILEKLIVLSGKALDPAAHAVARQTLERGVVLCGESAGLAAKKGGLALVEAAARHGDEVWRLAKICEGAPEALAARADTILEVAGRWGRDAACLEIKAPGCAEVLARKLGAAEMGELVSKAAPEEIKRLAVLSAQCSAEEARVAAGLWRQGNTRVLERLSVPRIAAYGLSAAAVIAAVQVPAEALHFLESALTATLGTPLAVVSWIFVLAVLAVLPIPVLWCTRRLFRRPQRRVAAAFGADSYRCHTLGVETKSLSFPER
ncbi:MAG: hypothetical protein EBS01_13270 [Verrucomicrobia bacterium]|nr:hypothetical protein [Verrucomicrobiota bacterium]